MVKLSSLQRLGTFAVLLGLLTACGSDTESTPDAIPVDPDCVEAVNHSDLAWIQEEILDGCAAFSVCHQGAAMSAGGLNLESGMSEAAMLGIDSQLFPEWKLVVPGQPDQSYLMVILGGAEGPIDAEAGTMPFNNPLLCTEKVDAIGRWIQSIP